jgi:hypothetical protein
MFRITLLALAAASLAFAGAKHPPLFVETFDKGADRWQPTDSAAWKIEETKNGKVYSLHQAKSKYEPPHRSPYNIALVKGLNVESFTLTVEAKSTATTGAHRDVCLFFGYQGPAKFYYVHVAGAAELKDPNANGIFLVHDAPRKKISEPSTHAKPWDDAFHTIRIERDTKTGDIRVYFDDGKEPVMKANDKTFAWGFVGIGSFDDVAEFRKVTVDGIRK